eukprot:5728828-Lingulodinium_polyedra.AAC.1
MDRAADLYIQAITGAATAVARGRPGDITGALKWLWALPTLLLHPTPPDPAAMGADPLTATQPGAAASQQQADMAAGPAGTSLAEIIRQRVQLAELGRYNELAARYADSLEQWGAHAQRLSGGPRRI